MWIEHTIRASGSFSSLSPPTRIDNAAVEIEQFGSGAVFVHSNIPRGIHPVSFLGCTADGFAVSIPKLWQFAKTNAGQCFEAEFVTLGHKTEGFSSINLQLTNVILDYEEPADFTLDRKPRPVQITFTPAKAYHTRVLHLCQTHCPTVTASLRIGRGEASLDELDSIVDEVCNALSLVQGRRVQWILRTAESADGAMVWAEFGETKTKSFSPDLLCVDPASLRGRSLPLSSLLTCFSRVCEFHRLQDDKQMILNSWLDARIQGDFLNARTLKYVVVMEALCSQAPGLGTRIPTADWRAARTEFLPKILDYLSTLKNVPSDVAQEICNSNSWGNLNRVPFRALLAARLEQLEISLCNPAERIRTFTEIRNKIVHDFDYLTADDFAECRLSPMDSTQQHFWVANFVDEVILRLFGLDEHVPTRG